ncbi:IS1595 family transposase [Methylococcus sp. Mc7]|uniref:IS1595 family transposase n=1 Tax=Methylococcus sp. Mc7 TaxID=2860258 RepID=UPI00351D9178
MGMPAPTQTPASDLRAGRDYPPSYADLRAWFPDDAACLDYLEWLRWPNGFVCPRCETPGHWRMGDGRFWCASCQRRVSVTSGTIFHRTRIPLMVWFAAAWHVTSAKNGVSAKTLHRLLGFGSYQTAWAMLHRFRAAMVRPGRDPLTGEVEVNEIFIGGVRPGKRGRGAEGKTLVAVAVELLRPKGFGRCRLRIIPDTRAPTLRAFLLDYVSPGAVIVTDGLSSYPEAIGDDYLHKPYVVARSGDPAHVALPGVHRVASLLKRWLLGTHQGAVEADHLQAYLDEFAFRFNRRKAEFRGLLFRRILEQAVQVKPIAYRVLVMAPAPKLTKPLPPINHQAHTSSFAGASLVHPWREHNR